VNKNTGFCEDCGKKHPGKMSTKEVAEHFNVSVSTVRNWCDGKGVKNRLPFEKPGRDYRIKRINVLNFTVVN